MSTATAMTRTTTAPVTATRTKALFTYDETCKFLGISRMQVHRLCVRGKLVRVHIGKRAARITAASLDAYLAALEANAA